MTADSHAPNSVSVEETPQIERDRAMINDARAQGKGSLMWAFTKLSGPGWLQSAITLGGGSLAGSLYLGVLAGYNLMWLQPLAMILGVVMLSAIGYVTLSTGRRPFEAINTEINPVLGWSWALATLMANFVWCMPQFALGTAALTQNLAPDTLGDAASMDDATRKLICALILFIPAAIVIWFYESGGWGIKLFEIILKVMVGTVVVCFFAVVAKMTLNGSLDWSTILAGFVPDFSMLREPSVSFDDPLVATGEFAQFWRERIVSDQRDVMVTAAATAVGINMTFLLPYSMLARGWDRDFRGLAIFDLATGLFVPFMLATGCVVIASAQQFHATPAPGLVEQSSDADKNLIGGYNGLLDARLAADDVELVGLDDAEKEALRADLPTADRRIAAMLVKRDAFQLSRALENLAGENTSRYLFGVGVLGMAISTIIILMLINGFVVCEMLGQPGNKWLHRGGAYAAGFVGAMGPFLWADGSLTWLAVPTSVFGMMLLPIAYFTFILMMNSRRLLGDAMPTGAQRLRWNLLMGVAAGLATFGAVWSIYSRKEVYAGIPAPVIGFAVMGGIIGLAVIVAFTRGSSTSGGKSQP